MATFAEGIRELAQKKNVSLQEIARIASRGDAGERAQLDRATKMAFGGGIPMRDALRHAGLIEEGS